MKYKQKFSRKDDRFDPNSLAAEIVKERMQALTIAVNDLFKGKVDKRIKRKKAA